jgi:hypothetical protein
MKKKLPLLIGLMALALMLPALGYGIPAGTILAENGNNVVLVPPHYEDFDAVSAPDLPEGWSSIVDNPTHTGALVRTVTTTSPNSPPNHVRIFSDTNTEANVMLISPLVENFSNLRIRFFSKCNLNTGVPDLIIGTMSDPADAATFVPFDTIIGIEELTNVYQRFIVEFNETHTSPAHIAFRHGGAGLSTRSIFIDDFVLEEIPTGPVMRVVPEAWDYGRVIEMTTKAKDFVISNEGIGTLTVNPEDISITGPDADRFVLTNLPGAVNLGTFETASVTVTFSPQTTGIKEATLMVAGQPVPLSGEGFDPTITEVPHLEDFSDLTTPDLPLGWTKIVQTTSTGNVESITTSAPYSPPHHIRFQNTVDANAQMLLVSPEITPNMNELRVRFQSKALLGDDNGIEVGIITNPNNIATYTALTSFTVTTSYQEFIVSFAEYEGTGAHIAFRAVFPTTVRTVFVDHVTIEPIPGEPIFQVSPASKDFGPIQIGTQSDPQEFTVTNTGEGLMVIQPEDVEITGADAGEFVLHNFPETVELAGGESAVLSVAFAPDTEATKSATLTIDGNDVPLSGEGIEATITEFPWVEDFTGTASGQIPFGWIRDASNWRVASTDHAGGEAPELRFLWNPAITGKATVVTPLINTSGKTEMYFSFRHMVDNFSGPGPYTLRVATVVDGIQHIIHEWVDPSNVAAEEFWTILTHEEHGIGAEDMRIAFVFDGYSPQINNWNIDDVTLDDVPQMYQVSFSVVEDSDQELPLEGAIISFTGYLPDLVSDETGNALIELPDGNYSAVVSLDGYEDAQITFTVDGNDLNVEVRMTDVIIAPDGLAISVEDETTGAVLFSWQHPEATLEFASFNVYLNDMDTPLAAEVEDVQYLFTGLQSGDYTAGVQAVYTTGVSAIATIDFNLEVITIPVVEIPWNENFTGVATNEIPEGWMRSGENWGVRNTSNAGGQAPEMQFNWAPEILGQVYLKSPYINTNGYDEIQLSFLNFVDNFSTPSNYNLRVVTLVEGVEHLVHEWESPGDFAAHLFTAILTAADHGVGADSLQIVWIFDGDSEDINWWNIDDIHVGEVTTTYTLTFEVEDQAGQPIADAVITFDGDTFDAGEYVFENLEPGTYSYTVSREGYHDTTGNVEIVDQDILLTVVIEQDQTSIGDLAGGPELHIYPNPASTVLTIAAEDQIREVRVIDIMGQVVLSLNIDDDSCELNVSGLKPGVYLIQVTTGSGTQTGRLQIAR